MLLREARRCGQSSVAPRRCAERSGVLSLFRFNVVAVGAGGGFQKRRELCENTGMDGKDMESRCEAE